MASKGKDPLAALLTVKGTVSVDDSDVDAEIVCNADFTEYSVASRKLNFT